MGYSVDSGQKRKATQMGPIGDRTATAAWDGRGSWSRVCFVLASFALLALFVPTETAAPRPSQAATVKVTLTVAAMPDGAVQLDPAGEISGNPFSECPHDYTLGECAVGYEVEAGPPPVARSVTLTAIPGPGQAFYRWSTPECGPEPKCTIELTASERPSEVFAMFTPAIFSVLIAGNGKVTGAGGTIDCVSPRPAAPATTDCFESTFPAGTLLMLTATPTAPGERVTWLFGCDYGEDENGATCALRSENRFVGVRFGSSSGPAPPFDVKVSLRVTRERQRNRKRDRRVDRVRPKVRRGSLTLRPACEADRRGGNRLEVRSLDRSTVHLREDLRTERWSGHHARRRIRGRTFASTTEADTTASGATATATNSGTIADSGEAAQTPGSPIRGLLPTRRWPLSSVCPDRDHEARQCATQRNPWSAGHRSATRAAPKSPNHRVGRARPLDPTGSLLAGDSASRQGRPDRDHPAAHRRWALTRPLPPLAQDQSRHQALPRCRRHRPRPRSRPIPRRRSDIRFEHSSRPSQR